MAAAGSIEMRSSVIRRAVAAVQTSAAPATGASPISATPTGRIQIDRGSQRSDAGAPVKPAHTRKAQLHHDYVRFVRVNPTLLLAQHNNLSQAEWSAFRSALEAKCPGAKARVLRVGLFDHALRVAAVTTDAEASKEVVNSRGMSQRAKEASLTQREEPSLRDLLSGPLCAITLPGTSTSSEGGTSASDIDPQALSKCVKHIDGTNGRLLLLGGRVAGTAMDVASLMRIAALPTLHQMRAELVGVLNHAAGAHLVSVLGARARQVASLLEARRVQLDEQSAETK